MLTSLDLLRCKTHTKLYGETGDADEDLERLSTILLDPIASPERMADLHTHLTADFHVEIGGQRAISNRAEAVEFAAHLRTFHAPCRVQVINTSSVVEAGGQHATVWVSRRLSHPQRGSYKRETVAMVKWIKEREGWKCYRAVFLDGYIGDLMHCEA